MCENEISKIVFEAGLKIHRFLGPGLLESSYVACLYYEIKKAGLVVKKEMSLPIIYEEVQLEVGYRLDLIIEGKVIIEVKAVESLQKVHKSQVLTYLRLSGCKLGLLINFNTELFKDGFKRVINGNLDDEEK